MSEQWSISEEDGIHPWSLWCQQAPKCDPAPPLPPITEWRHTRWHEPHRAEVAPGSIQRLRAHGGRAGASCVTCGEVLVPTTAPRRQQPAPSEATEKESGDE